MKNRKMKDQKKTFFRRIVEFFLVTVCVVFYIATFFIIFLNFKFINTSVYLLILGISCVVVPIIVVLCRNTNLSKKLTILFYKYMTEFILGYVCSSLFFASIKSEIIWTFDDLKDMISLQWAILGISITIYLVWNVIGLEWLDKLKLPSNTANTGLLDKATYVLDKKIYNLEATQKYIVVLLIRLNVLVLLLATACAYLLHFGNKVNLFNQTVAIFSFMVCTNTISLLISESLESFIKKRKKVFADVEITREDIEQEGMLAQAKAGLLAIDDLQFADEEEKNEMKRRILEKIYGADFS